MKIDPEYISNEDIDWQRQSQRTYENSAWRFPKQRQRQRQKAAPQTPGDRGKWSDNRMSLKKETQSSKIQIAKLEQLVFWGFWLARAK